MAHGRDGSAFALHRWLADHGTWYLVVLGAVATAVTLLAPSGRRGAIDRDGRVRLFAGGLHGPRGAS